MIVHTEGLPRLDVSVPTKNMTGEMDAKKYQCYWEACSDVCSSLQMLARHLIRHASRGQLCQWTECAYHSTNAEYLEVHVLQHIYQNENYANHFANLDQWAEQLPSGHFHVIHTDLSLCPPKLRSQLGLLLFDELFKIPSNKQYTSMDHKQHLLNLEADNPEGFYENVEDYRRKCEEIGIALEFNREVWTKDVETFKQKFVCVSSGDHNIVLEPKMDVYCMKQPQNCIKSFPTTRPELAGYGGNLKIHPCYSPPKRKRCYAECSKIRSVLKVDEPWKKNVSLNLRSCHDAIEKEIDIVKDLFAKGFLSAQCDTLIKCEKQALKLASYPSCTEGVLFFTVIVNSDDVFYIRFLESGCYRNIVSQVAIDRLCQTTGDRIFLSKISTEDDIKHETGKFQDRHKKGRSDLVLKDNMASLKKNLVSLSASADSCAVSLKYFLHVAGKGCGTKLCEKSSDKWFVGSNLPVTVIEELKTFLLSFPLHQQEETCKTNLSFCEEALSDGSSLFTQSAFLNYLSNDPYRFLKGKFMRYNDRFPTSPNPTSLRYRIMKAYKAGNISFILEHLQPIASTSVSSEVIDNLSAPRENAAFLDSDTIQQDTLPEEHMKRFLLLEEKNNL